MTHQQWYYTSNKDIQLHFFSLAIEPSRRGKGGCPSCHSSINIPSIISCFSQFSPFYFMPESEPFHEQHTKRECYYFKVSQCSQYELLCVNNEISCLERTRCFRREKTQNFPHGRQLQQRRDSSTRLTDGLFYCWWNRLAFHLFISSG